MRKQTAIAALLVAAAAGVFLAAHRPRVAPRTAAPLAPRRFRAGPASPSPLQHAAVTSAARPVAAPGEARPSSASVALAASERTLAHAAWGDGVGELGRRDGTRAAPEGPMSFAVDAAGRATVVDQVNARAEVFAPGEAPRVVPLPSQTFQDVAFSPHGDLVLLDRLGTASVAFASADGHVDREVALAGPGVPSGGDVTALFARDDGTWVEVGHESLVRVADASGHADPARPAVAGRFSADGASLLRAARSGSTHVVVTLQPRGERPALLARVEFALPVHEIMGLEPTADGGVVVGASLAQASASPPYDALERAEVIVVLDRLGVEQSRLRLPAQPGAEESFRRLRVGQDGALYHMAYGLKGVTLRRYAL